MMKKSIILFMALAIVACCFGCVNSDPEQTGPLLSSNTSENEKGDDYLKYFETFTPILRFSVASDFHIREAGHEFENDMLAKMFTSGYSFAENSDLYKNMDLFVAVGDLVNAGTEAEWGKFSTIWRRNIHPDTRELIILGNHEFFYLDDEVVYDRLEKHTGAGVNQHIIVNGYHFISISPENIDERQISVHFGKTATAYLEAELEKAAADDPTGKKPIFVFQHMPVRGTVYGSESGGVSNLTAILKKYPQVIDFAGHSHWPLENPRSIWQGEFTALNTGTMSYTCFGVLGSGYSESTDLFPRGENGEWGDFGNLGVSDAAMCTFVEVDANGAVQIIAYNLESDKEIRRYYIMTPSDPSTFLYSGDRQETSEAPVFADDTEIKIEKVSFNLVNISFPGALSCKDVVESYRVELWKEGSKVNQVIRTSGYYFPNMFTHLTAGFGELTPGTEYEIRVYAVNCFGKDSEKPLIANVKTDDSTLVPAETVPDADVLRTLFYEDKVTDGISGEVLATYGNPKTVFDATLNRYVGDFDGDSGYFFSGFANYYDKMSKSITMETYIKVDKINGSYTDPFTNHEAGGIGFEIASNGLAQFMGSIGGSYVAAANYTLDFGRYYHLVGTFDGSCLKMYVNGFLVDTYNVEDVISWPSNEKAHGVGVGGDTGIDELQACLVGQIASANVYSTVLTPEEVYRAYLNVTGG